MHTSKDIRIAFFTFILYVAPMIHSMLEQPCKQMIPEIRAYIGNAARIHIDWRVLLTDKTMFNMNFKNATHTLGSAWGFKDFKSDKCEIENMDCIVTNNTPTHTKSLDCSISSVDELHAGTYFFNWADSGDNEEKCLELRIVHDNGIQIITDITDARGNTLDQHKNAYVRDEEMQYTKPLIVPPDVPRYVNLQMADNTMQMDFSCYEQYNNIKKGRKPKKEELTSANVSFPVTYPSEATFNTYSIVCEIRGPGVTIEIPVVKEGTNQPISDAVGAARISSNSYETAYMIYGGLITLFIGAIATASVYPHVIDRQWGRKKDQKVTVQEPRTNQQDNYPGFGCQSANTTGNTNDPNEDRPDLEMQLLGEPDPSYPATN